jgi:hypothetical protein
LRNKTQDDSETMSISSSKSEIAKELERAKQVIERLWEVVSNLDNLLEPIERELAIKDFDPDGRQKDSFLCRILVKTIQSSKFWSGLKKVKRKHHQ